MRNEPGYIDYQRRHGGDRVLEAVGVDRFPGARKFIIVCGLSGGASSIMIRWYAHDVIDARKRFREWLSESWQTMTTDLAGNGLPNGLDFKTSQISWFNITTE
ncbi:hypothetical protein [Actinophytocola sp.]|uniref:hypothetical protein n=1 Tax=Actinophytocola sp. TaxID=1872138 RepID=UPI00389ABFE0